jgi:antitoxin VapB
MGHQLNIKSDEAYQLATELAALKGESLTEAVTASLRERLERERRAAGKEAKLRDILALAARIRAKTGGAIMSNAELDAYLYDPETGLPR